MVQFFSAIDFYNPPKGYSKLISHYSRKEIRLMRGFVATNFFRLFFLHPKLGTKEFESTRV